MFDKTTQLLADFISTVGYEDIPPNVATKAKEFVLDFVRLAILGSRLQWGKKTREVFHEMGGKEESTVIAFGDRLPAASAAYVNGTMAHGLENDDTHVGAVHHPGVVVIPAVLAVAERGGLGGRALITGVVTGYEVMIRLGLGMVPSLLTDRGFHSTAVLGHFGAAAGAAKLLGLSQEQTAHGLGLAAAYASGLTNWMTGGMVKYIHAGKAAKAGVETALLAAAGVTGPRAVFEGKGGFCQGYAEKYKLDAFTTGLGEEWKTLEVHLKPHATSRHTQSSVEAAATIAAQHDIRAEDIAAIQVRTSPFMAKAMYNPAPIDVIQAQANIPYAVATALVKGGRRSLTEFVLFEDISDGMQNPRVQALAQRVELVGDPSYDIQKGNAEVTIRLANGRAYTKRVDVIRGSPENPFTMDELRKRFLTQASAVLLRARLENAADLIQSLERLDNAATLTGLLK